MQTKRDILAHNKSVQANCQSITPTRESKKMASSLRSMGQ